MFGLRKAVLSLVRRKGYYVINRDGCIYYIDKNHEILNPETVDGKGLLLLLPVSRWEKKAAFYIERAFPTPIEETLARIAYAAAIGNPRKGLVAVPAFFFPACYEDTPANRSALRSSGAIWV